MIKIIGKREVKFDNLLGEDTAQALILEEDGKVYYQSRKSAIFFAVVKEVGAALALTVPLYLLTVLAMIIAG